MSKKVPRKVMKELEKIIRECLVHGNFDYIVHRIKFVEDLYIKSKTGNDVWDNIKRWDVMTVMTKDSKLIDRKFLSKDKLDCLDALYESAKESV